MRRKAFLFLIVLFFLNFAYSKEFRDPFFSLLPQKVEKKEITKREEIKMEESYYFPPEVNIEGVLWGTDTPLTIIDGDVYKVGDKIKDIEAKIFKIEKNNVFIIYKGRLYRLTTKKKEE
jgi:hypothetical protein